LIEVTTPQPGDVVVWANHVAIVVEVGSHFVGFVGGNQGNQVTLVYCDNINRPNWSNQNFIGYYRLHSFPNL